MQRVSQSVQGRARAWASRMAWFLHRAERVGHLAWCLQGAARHKRLDKPDAPCQDRGTMQVRQVASPPGKESPMQNCLIHGNAGGCSPACEAAFDPAMPPCTIRERGCAQLADLDARTATGFDACLPCSTVRAERALSALYAIANARDLAQRRVRCKRCGSLVFASRLNANATCVDCARELAAWKGGHVISVKDVLGVLSS